jgi:hypothetical protein
MIWSLTSVYWHDVTRAWSASCSAGDFDDTNFRAFGCFGIGSSARSLASAGVTGAALRSEEFVRLPHGRLHGKRLM